MKKTPIQRAIDVQGQTATAEALGYSIGFLNNIYHGRKQLPADRVRDLERISGYRVSRYQLAPEIFGRESDEKKRLCECAA